jgi:hypothetical protein
MPAREYFRSSLHILVRRRIWAPLPLAVAFLVLKCTWERPGKCRSGAFYPPGPGPGGFGGALVPQLPPFTSFFGRMSRTFVSASFAFLSVVFVVQLLIYHRLSQDWFLRQALSYTRS